LQVYAWSRFAEVSADRTGLLCARDLDVATKTLFKLASGLRHASGIRVDVDELLSQAADMESEDSGDPRAEGRADWFATHPFSPLRLKSVQLFAASELFTQGGTRRATLESETQQLMSIMDPSYLTDTSDAAKVMRRFLFAGGVLVADASGGISKEEVTVLEKFLGPGAIDRASPAAIRDALPRMSQSMLDEVPALRRGQVIRDLCVVALADGRVDPGEERVLNELATAVGVDTSLVTRTLSAARPLD
jgi:tellurite resistance protein